MKWNKGNNTVLWLNFIRTIRDIHGCVNIVRADAIICTRPACHNAIRKSNAYALPDTTYTEVWKKSIEFFSTHFYVLPFSRYMQKCYCANLVMENCFWILNEALDDFFFSCHTLAFSRMAALAHQFTFWKCIKYWRSINLSFRNFCGFYMKTLSTDTDKNAKNKLWCLKAKNERTSSRWPLFVGRGIMLVSTMRSQIARTVRLTPDNQICVCVHVCNLSAHVSFLLKMGKLLETFRHLFSNRR